MWPFSRKKKEEPSAPVQEAPVPPPETELQRLQREVFERVVDGKPGPLGIDDWRLQIYAGMYEARTHDALIEDVPYTAKLLADRFPALVKAYVAEQPSTHHSLARLGHAFAPWLRKRAAGDGAPLTPGLADLAELEWARSESFVADSFTPVEPEAVQQLGPERFTQCWMHFVPSLRLLELEHDVLPLWKAMEEKAEPPLPAALAQKTYVIVWRKGFEVFHVAIQEDEYQAMKAVQARETVAQVCERFAARGDDAAHVAFQALGSWLTEGMIAALREPAGPAFDGGSF